MKWNGNGIGRWRKGKLMWLKLGKKITPLGMVNLLQDKWWCRNLRAPKHSQDKTKLRETSLTNLTQFVYSNFTVHSTWNYMSQTPLFIVWGGQISPKEKVGNLKEKPFKMEPKRESHGRCDLLPFLLIGPKLLSTPSFYVLLNLL